MDAKRIPVVKVRGAGLLDWWWQSRTPGGGLVIRIQLSSPHILLNAHLQALLSQRRDLAIVGVESNPERAIECARELEPDVVIAESRNAAWDLTILQILKGGIAPVVIVFDAAGAHLRLYRSEAWPLESGEDLEQAIRAEPVFG